MILNQNIFEFQHTYNISIIFLTFLQNSFSCFVINSGSRKQKCGAQVLYDRLIQTLFCYFKQLAHGILTTEFNHSMLDYFVHLLCSVLSPLERIFLKILKEHECILPLNYSLSHKTTITLHLAYFYSKFFTFGKCHKTQATK